MRLVDADMALLYLNDAACEQIKEMPTVELDAEPKKECGLCKSMKGVPLEGVIMLKNCHTLIANYCPNCGRKWR